jgi:hypothetical protein
MQRTFTKTCILLKVESVCRVKRSQLGKFSQGRSKAAGDARQGRPVETVTEETVQRVEKLIRATGG